jgi:hypothetical protein
VDAADCVFLAIISLASSLWYVTRLAFYSDDWGLFGAFTLTPDSSLSGLVRSSFLDRPAQGVYSILLFRVFGLRPLGYHVTNAVVLATVSVLLYITLRKLQPSRVAALGVALAYIVLPNYSTARFWFAAFAAPLSVAFYLLSLLIDVNSATLAGRALLVRRISAVAALLVSVMLYEATLPFFFLNPLLAWWAARRGQARPPFSWPAFAGVNIAVLVLVAIYKARTSPRLHAPRGLPALVWSIVGNLFRGGYKDGDYGLNLRAAFHANYVDYLFALPRVVWSLHLHHPLGWLPLCSLVFGVAIFMYVRSIPDDLTRRGSIALSVLGLAIFVLGYSMFLTNKAIQITPTGIGNRTSIAAALGVAMTAVGLFGLLASAIRNRTGRSAIFAALLGAYAAGGFFVLSTLSSFWIDAYGREQEILNDIEAHNVAFPSKTTLMLSGICSYKGPAIVFESDWDLSGALRLHYGDRTLSADVLRPHFYSVTDKGVATMLYEGEDDYEFGSYLVLYDYRRKTSHVLSDREATERVFHENPPDADCPPGLEGVGERVF